MNTRRKSRSYFLNSPASVAIQGMDCDMTCAECRPISRSAASTGRQKHISNPSNKTAVADDGGKMQDSLRMIMTPLLVVELDFTFRLKLQRDSLGQILL